MIGNIGKTFRALDWGILDPTFGAKYSPSHAATAFSETQGVCDGFRWLTSFDEYVREWSRAGYALGQQLEVVVMESWESTGSNYVRSIMRMLQLDERVFDWDSVNRFRPVYSVADTHHEELGRTGLSDTQNVRVPEATARAMTRECCVLQEILGYPLTWYACKRASCAPSQPPILPPLVSPPPPRLAPPPNIPPASRPISAAPSPTPQQEAGGTGGVCRGHGYCRDKLVLDVLRLWGAALALYGCIRGVRAARYAWQLCSPDLSVTRSGHERVLNQEPPDSSKPTKKAKGRSKKSSKARVQPVGPIDDATIHEWAGAVPQSSSSDVTCGGLATSEPPCSVKGHSDDDEREVHANSHAHAHVHEPPNQDTQEKQSAVAETNFDDAEACDAQCRVDTGAEDEVEECLFRL